MSVKITGIEKNSYADNCNIKPGHTLVCVNGHEIKDVLDYRFFIQSKKLTLILKDGQNEYTAKIRKSSEFSDIGLLFETYLMDKQQSCKNKCIFCFIDQMPKGLRDTLYFKDDDSRLSFLFGNYITLTGLSEYEAKRICELHISPVNISVHTMNRDLRVEMMKNPNAGKSLDYLEDFYNAGIEMNIQLVLCPGINDGEELRFSLESLKKYADLIKSIALVPVGITKYRDGLYPLRTYTKEEAEGVISAAEEFNAHFSYFNNGRVLVFPSDEFFLIAGRELPGEEYYGEFSQLDNGVGMCTLLKSEFNRALNEETEREINRNITVATGESAYNLLCELSKQCCEKFRGLNVNVIKIRNDFFGDTVTVAGLITGKDLLNQLKGKDLGDELLLPRVSLRNEGDKFLDDVTLSELSQKLDIKITPVKNDGYILLNAMINGGE